MEFIRSNWVFGLGFLAQALFGTRIVVQWYLTEKKGEVVSPGLFWKLSLSGSILFLIYGVFRYDVVIILGQLISYVIYVRNLQLKGEWNRFPPGLRLLVILIPGTALGWALFHLSAITFLSKETAGNFILALGLIGQLLLNFRFIYQLYYSERHKESILPAGFWYLSLGGAMLVVVYAASRRDPVLLLAQGLAIVPYVRNLMLSRRKVT